MNQKYTLAEIESYFRKVAQVAGLGWGLAEEAGKSARWLAAFDLPGPELMLVYLQGQAAENYEACKPDCKLAVWQASGGILCPVVTAAAIADRATQMLTHNVIRLGPVAYPLLLAAGVGQAARCFKTVFTVSWAEVNLSCHENGISLEGNTDDLLLPVVESASCRQAADSVPEQLPSTLAYTMDSEIWQTVQAIAFKTYAPATELSRAGAGAGLSDND